MARDDAALRLECPLASERLRVRAATPEDLPGFARLLAHPSVASWWGADPLPEVTELVGGGDPNVQVVAVSRASDDEVIGMAYIGEEPDPGYRHGTLDVTLAAGAQDRGLGTELVRLLAGWMIDVRGHHRLTIDPAADNARAIACYRKVGFREVGVMRAYERRDDGRWHDGLLMDLLAHELVRTPPLPGTADP